MEEKKTDKRILNTNAQLTEALLSLLREKPVDKIGPTELCRRAGINRNTFYAHYYSARELLESLENDLFAQVVDAVGDSVLTAGAEELLAAVCSVFERQKELCAVLFSENGDSVFLDKLARLGKGCLLAEWEKQGIRVPEARSDLLFAFLSGGAASFLRAWGCGGMRLPPEQAAKTLVRILRGSVTALSGSEERSDQ